MSEARKWTTLAGPRQTKAVEQALRSLRWLANQHVELEGVIGVSERRSVISVMVGGGEQNELVPAKLLEIAAKYDWTITPANYLRIVADIATAKTECEKVMPIVDNRRTPEQEAERIAGYEKSQEREDQKRTAHAAAVEVEVARLRKLYPWADAIAAKGLSSQAHCAASIKRELSDAFPGIVFSVKSKGFSMGDSVNVHWDLGPTEKEVSDIIGKYEMGSFDGSDDSYKYDRSVLGDAVDKLLGRSKYIHANRHFPEDIREQIGRDICERQNVAYNGESTRNVFGPGDVRELAQHVGEITQSTSFSAGEQYAGLRDATQDERGAFAIIKSRPASEPQRRANPGPAAGSVLVVENDEKDGVEIRFPEKPSESIISRLKSAGWRWAKHNQCWYRRRTEQAKAFARAIQEECSPVLV